MPPSVPLFASALLLAASALGAEVWRTRVHGSAEWRGLPYVALVALGAVSGLTLLLALSGREILLALALAPLTTLCAARLWVALDKIAPVALRILLILVVLAGGSLAGLSVTPTPLTRDMLRGAGSGPSETILPVPSRSVRG